jgi:hypothetical protein
MKKRYILTFILLVIGALFGILSKAGDVAVQGNIIGNTLHTFGLVTSGLFIWIVVCTGISIMSKSRIFAVINLFCFLTAMLLAYYLYSYFVVEYLVMRIVKFWAIMLIPATLSGCIMWNVRANKILKRIVIIAGTLVMCFDIFAQGLLITVMAMEAVIYVLFLMMILSKRSNKS